jgi:predicted secreted protein
LSVVLEGVRLDSVPELTELPDELTLRPDEEQTVRLPSLAGAGYVWAAKVDDEAVASASVEFEPAGETLAGRKTFSENERLTVRGLRPGTTKVELVQRRTWETGVEPAAAHILTVNVVAGETATEQGGKT